MGGIDPSRAEANALSTRLGSTAARLKLKGIDGGPHKRWSMWFNSTQREEPYLGSHVGSTEPKGEGLVKPRSETGGAWLSSARAVRCWVKSRNERNPYPMLLPGNAGHSWGTAGGKLEEGGDDGKSSCPLCPGPHTCYNGRYKALLTREGRESQKAGLSSDRRLQLAFVKAESLVSADQQAALNTFPGLVHTARHTTKAGCTRSR